MKSITLRIQHEAMNNWVFPNELPFGLKKNMSRQWVNENIGTPLRSAPPYVVMKRGYGWTDLYEVKGRSIPVSMQISYDVMNNVRAVTFMPISELRW